MMEAGQQNTVVLLILFVLWIITVCMATIKIRDLKVPMSIESGSVHDVILDCDYVADGESGVEVKWFFNGLVDQIYQWIPETNRSGQALGPLRDNIDVTYKISNDRDTMYRALHIFNITPDMSGNYTCKVSSYLSEDMHTKSMIIYEPADDGLTMDIFEDESVIVCEASGIYPKPEMTLSVYNSNGSVTVQSVDEENLELDDRGRYNVSSILRYESNNLSETFQYSCELHIPGTTYHLSKFRTFELGSGAACSQYSSHTLGAAVLNPIALFILLRL